MIEKDRRSWRIAKLLACRRVLLIAIVAIGLIVSEARAAPITFNTALPVGKGEFVLREQLVIARSGDDPSGAQRDMTSRALVSVLGYGVNGRLAIFGALPYLDKELDVTVSGSRQQRSANGLGDLSLFGRYTVFKRDAPGRTLRLAPFAGITAPTGDDDKRDALGLLPPSVQPGTGAWDIFGGAVLTYQTLDYQIDAQLSYRHNGEANGFERGDVLRADASLQYRLWPGTLKSGVPGFLYGVVETALFHSDKNRISGSEDPNSGGQSIIVTPGLQYVTKRWIVEAGVDLPLLQDLNGTGLESDYVVRAGFRLNF